MDWKNKEILITGGTGSLGKAVTKRLLTECHPKGIRIYSRDELKQWEMRQIIDQWECKGNVSFLIGDVRDEKRLSLAMEGVNIVIHTAAMKQVPSCEENPIEAVKTNIQGSQNVITAAINSGTVERVMGISTDKACMPINLYGVTKAAMEKLFIHGNVYSKGKERIPKISCCRYGNVIGSRGSVIPLFKEQAKTGTITVTDPDMTRFWITLPRVAKFIVDNLESMEGGEIFVPFMPSMSMFQIAEAIAPEANIKIIGVRKGEKMHEDLVSPFEKENTLFSEEEKKFTINPNKYVDMQTNSFDSFDNYWTLDKEQLLAMEAEGAW